MSENMDILELIREYNISRKHIKAELAKQDITWLASFSAYLSNSEAHILNDDKRTQLKKAVISHLNNLQLKVKEVK